MSEFKRNERIAQMIEMHENGSTYEEIGKAFNISRQRVFQLIGGRDRIRFKELTSDECIYPNLRNWLNNNRITRTEFCRMIYGNAHANGLKSVCNFLKNKNSLTKKYVIDRYLKVTGLTYEELFEMEEK